MVVERARTGLLWVVYLPDCVKEGIIGIGRAVLISFAGVTVGSCLRSASITMIRRLLVIVFGRSAQ